MINLVKTKGHGQGSYGDVTEEEFLPPGYHLKRLKGDLQQTATGTHHRTFNGNLRHSSEILNHQGITASGKHDSRIGICDRLKKNTCKACSIKTFSGRLQWSEIPHRPMFLLCTAHYSWRDNFLGISTLEHIKLEHRMDIEIHRKHMRHIEQQVFELPLRKRSAKTGRSTIGAISSSQVLKGEHQNDTAQNSARGMRGRPLWADGGPKLFHELVCLRRGAYSDVRPIRWLKPNISMSELLKMWCRPKIWPPPQLCELAPFSLWR